MLNIIFGRDFCKQDYVLDTRVYFRRHKKPEWFEDDFVKKFLMGVDGTTVLFEEALKNRWGHGISTDKISTGCKTLCCIYYDTEGKWFFGSAMGDNCVPYLMEIARNKEVNIFLEHYMDIPNEYFEEGLVRKDGIILGEYDFDDAYGDWCEYMDKKYDE